MVDPEMVLRLSRWPKRIYRQTVAVENPRPMPERRAPNEAPVPAAIVTYTLVRGLIAVTGRGMSARERSAGSSRRAHGA